MIPVRESIPADDQYLRELGRATYNFAYLEWGVVWLTETIEQGFLAKAKALTAGQIATRFFFAVQSIPTSDTDNSELAELAELARRFQELVEERNRLIHANPFTAEDGAQRLLYSGKHGRKDWSEDLIQQFSDAAASLGAMAARLLHAGRYDRWVRGSGAI